MRKKFLFLLSLSIYSFQSLGQSTTYNLKDLEALEAQKSYREFLQHAHDIIPSERGEYWEKLVNSVAEAHITNLLQMKNFDYDILNEVILILNWPTLRSNDYFFTQLNSYFVKYYNFCLSNYSENKCEEQRRLITENNVNKDDLARKIVPLLKSLQDEQKKLLNINLFSLVQNYLKRAESEFDCKNPEFQTIIWNTLMFEINESENIHKDCLKQLNLKASAQLISETRKKQEVAFRILTKAETITDAQHSLFHLLYILENGLPGEELNSAFRELLSLSQNIERRHEVLTLINKMTSFPDKIFGMDKQNKQSVALIKQITLYFPEFIDNYANECLAYFRGEIKKRGIHCFNFFNLAKKYELLPTPKILEYNKLTNLIKNK
jgi:hypothetical protein